ncbi:hypothetical protein L0Z42_13195 [Burkholderia multivorans]|uniref:hypothetical protein n=1 Tax=Burkholderia multivorans TaxID=87883 RepID=UPI0020185299|nr:hypothetical protein [Burkholderia multivorans]MCO1371494.1 hypothetical protein [Burkholderia multivorans]MCO1457258.1 hypothetical protein [Burkholderia multivorans]MCO1466244.1 hypothetical protein [Burkholderia multivorans]UQO16061.1 hypothetical protein L0Z02_10640 [Burkholderia multivorans]UQO86572.1 hypothetical protein L0Y86_15820 [Burkholderia multivorans]
MIDTEKMKALATQLREWNWLNDPTPQKAADAIDLLLAEVEAAAADKRDAEKIKQAAHEVLNWTEAKHRPPKAEVVPTGEMVLVRVHALVELHAALAQRQGEGS